MLTALTIHLFNVERNFVAFLRVSQRAFLAWAFFMLIRFIFSYSETFFVVFYLSFYFVLSIFLSSFYLLFRPGRAHPKRNKEQGQPPPGLEHPRTSGGRRPRTRTTATESKRSGHEGKAVEMQRSRVEDEAEEKQRNQDEDKA